MMEFATFNGIVLGSGGAYHCSFYTLGQMSGKKVKNKNKILY
jgi:hypothetical protein